MKSICETLPSKDAVKNINSDLLQILLNAIPNLTKELEEILSKLNTEAASKIEEKNNLFVDPNQFPLITDFKQVIEETITFSLIIVIRLWQSIEN